MTEVFNLPMIVVDTITFPMYTVAIWVAHDGRGDAPSLLRWLHKRTAIAVISF